MAFATYQPPERTDGGSFKPSEHMDTPIIVAVREHKTGIVTEFSPDGKDGVIVDVCDFGNSDVQTDVLWMNGALVDGLKGYVGQTLVIRLEWADGKSGRRYATIAQASPAEMKSAEAYVKANGDPFAPSLATVGKANSDIPF
jgi:hypothetical protein